jgi:hypothetical protein
VNGRRSGGRRKTEDARDILGNQRDAHRPVAPQRADNRRAVTDRPRLLRLPSSRRGHDDSGIETREATSSARRMERKAPACAIACGRFDRRSQTPPP